MDQKLVNLVNEVDQEASKFASFDDYLASKDQEPAITGARENECPKPAVDAVENSSSSQSAKVEETAGSSTASSAVPASTHGQPQKSEREKAIARVREVMNRVNNGKTEVLSHPVAPNVTAPAPPSTPVKLIQEFDTTLQIRELKWDTDKVAFLHEETTARDEEPKWWQRVYLAGRMEGEKLKDPEAIIERIHILNEECERRKVAVRGLRGALEASLKACNSEQRAKHVADLDRGYRVKKNLESASRMKVERKPKESVIGVGVKLADAMGAIGMRGEKLIMYLKKNNAWDAATEKHVATKWGGK